MKTLTILLSLSLLLFSACGQNKPGPLNSKEAILKHLKKANPELSEDDVCIDECSLMKDLIIVGYFAHDRGCGSGTYYFKGYETALDTKTIKEILLNSGFEKDNLQTVENYHKEVVNQYQSFFTTMPEDFDTANYNFTPPTTKVQDGMIISTMWVQEPSGMLPQASFHLSTLTFELDGTYKETKTSNHFSVDY